MKEINSLFKLKEVKEIREKLKKIIQEIEMADKTNQKILLREVVEKAKETEKELREKYTIMECLSFFPEDISPLALLVEEICNAAEDNQDILKVLKFNLHNYFNQFKEVKNGNWHTEVKDFLHIIDILIAECNYFEVLKKRGCHLSIMMFHYRFRKYGMQVLNYSIIKNKNFAIHSFYCDKVEKNSETVGEIILKQFGYLLKKILVSNSQKAPNGFMELLDYINEMPKIDEESKELTALFASFFVHYIIEKMEIRIKQEIGEEFIKKLESGDEKIIKKMLEYFDDLFANLLKQREEWGDDEKCPCGSGKIYKNCCKKRRLKYYKQDDTKYYTKAIPINAELKGFLEKEKIRFKHVFGRVPGNDDYVQGGVLLRDFWRGFKLMKRENNINKAWLYGSNKTGYMLTEENKDFISEREEKQFNQYMYEYQRIMKGSIKEKEWNLLQAVESINFILESMLQNVLPDMIYVLNLSVNFYSQNIKEGEKFIIKNIRDFLVFCAYKTSLQLNVLQQLVNGEYYDTAMAEIRIIYEILISMRAYKKNPRLFEEKILSIMGVELGIYKKIKGIECVSNRETGKKYNYHISKFDLAKYSGDYYKELYRTLYHELSGFIHLDTEHTKGIFQDKNIFEEVDECLMAGFLGMILSLEVIMELIEFKR